MLLNFKNGHTPNVEGPFLCKVKRIIDKEPFYVVLRWNKKKNRWEYYKPIMDCAYPYRVLGWVRIREK